MDVEVPGEHEVSDGRRAFPTPGSYHLPSDRRSITRSLNSSMIRDVGIHSSARSSWVRSTWRSDPGSEPRCHSLGSLGV
ncbi:unnamed protein product [Gadus morhua 'NCC']